MPLTRRRPLRARARIWRVLEAVRIAPRRMRGLQASTGAPLRRLLLVLKLLRSSDHATCHEETVINHPAQTCVALTTARKIVEQEHDQIRSADSDRGVEIPKAATTGIEIFEMLTHSIGQDEIALPQFPQQHECPHRAAPSGSTVRVDVSLLVSLQTPLRSQYQRVNSAGQCNLVPTGVQAAAQQRLAEGHARCDDPYYKQNQISKRDLELYDCPYP